MGTIVNPRAAWRDLISRIVGVDLLTGVGLGSIGSDIPPVPFPWPTDLYKDPRTLTANELSRLAKDMVNAFVAGVVVCEDWCDPSVSIAYMHPLVLLASVDNIPYTIIRAYLLLLGREAEESVPVETITLTRNDGSHIECPHPITYGHRQPTDAEWSVTLSLASELQPIPILAILGEAAPVRIRDTMVKAMMGEGGQSVMCKIVQTAQ